jgi:hypothetical protein
LGPVPGRRLLGGARERMQHEHIPVLPGGRARQGAGPCEPSMQAVPGPHQAASAIQGADHGKSWSDEKEGGLVCSNDACAAVAALPKAAITSSLCVGFIIRPPLLTTVGVSPTSRSGNCWDLGQNL